jgi:hypothetical protein
MGWHDLHLIRRHRAAVNGRHRPIDHIESACRHRHRRRRGRNADRRAPPRQRLVGEARAQQARQERHRARAAAGHVFAGPATHEDRHRVFHDAVVRHRQLLGPVGLAVEVAVRDAGHAAAARQELVPDVAAPLLAREADLGDRPCRRHARERGGHDVVVVDAGLEIAHGIELQHRVDVRGRVFARIRLDAQRVGEVLGDIDKDGRARPRRAVTGLLQPVTAQLRAPVAPVRPEGLRLRGGQRRHGPRVRCRRDRGEEAQRRRRGRDDRAHLDRNVGANRAHRLPPLAHTSSSAHA